jgi:hypothetical protein
MMGEFLASKTLHHAMQNECVIGLFLGAPSHLLLKEKQKKKLSNRQLQKIKHKCTKR